jgi:thiamine biosynthesis lipoprotein
VTGGLFDPRILTDLERLGYRGAPIGVAHGDAAGDDSATGPGPNDVERSRAGLDAPGSTTDWLLLDGRRPDVALGAPVDLGGIGKGLALRWAWHRLWPGFRAPVGAGALLEAGGDVVAAGPAPEGGPWLVGIEDASAGGPSGAPDPGSGPAPDRASGPAPDPATGFAPDPWSGPAPDPALGPIAVVAIERGAVCTSSITIHRWRDPVGRTVHHLVHPATGRPGGEGLLAVTVAGPDPAWAEVWSKALFLEGARGIADAARRRGLAAWWIDMDGRLRMTPAARPRTVWMGEG